MVALDCPLADSMNVTLRSFSLASQSFHVFAYNYDLAATVDDACDCNRVSRVTSIIQSGSAGPQKNVCGVYPLRSGD